MTTSTDGARTKRTQPLASLPIPVQAKLAAAWTSFMFLYAYVDILGLYKPGSIANMLEGRMFEFEVSAGLLAGVLIAVSIPGVMVALSMMLPARVNRTTNLAVACLYVPFTRFNATGETWEWAGFFGVAIAAEVALLAMILHAAWKWPRVSRSPAGDGG